MLHEVLGLGEISEYYKDCHSLRAFVLSCRKKSQGEEEDGEWTIKK